jgi:hypothetical protein
MTPSINVPNSIIRRDLDVAAANLNSTWNVDAANANVGRRLVAETTR